jgi:hypothetical protein
MTDQATSGPTDVYNALMNMISNLAANISNSEINSLCYWLLLAANFDDDEYGKGKNFCSCITPPNSLELVDTVTNNKLADVNKNGTEDEKKAILKEINDGKDTNNLVPALALYNGVLLAYLPESFSKIITLSVDLENLPSIKYEQLTELKTLAISGDFSGSKGEYINSVPEQINRIIIENGKRIDGDLDFSKIKAKAIIISNNTHITGKLMLPGSLECLDITNSSIGNLSNLAECNNLTDLTIMDSHIGEGVVAPSSLVSVLIDNSQIDSYLDISKCKLDTEDLGGKKFTVKR